MDPLYNPFSPGAGNRPPELAGRSDILNKALLALGRIKAGRSDRSPLMIGEESGRLCSLMRLQRRQMLQVTRR